MTNTPLMTIKRTNPLYDGPIWTTTPGSLVSVIEGSAIDVTVNATSANGTVVYNIKDGHLPDGCVLDGSTGVISGTSISYNRDTKFDFTIMATDNFTHAFRNFSITVKNDTPVWISTPGLFHSQFVTPSLYTWNGPSVQAIDPHSLALTYSLISGTLPTGLTFNTNGTFTGTIEQISMDMSYDLVIGVTNANGYSPDNLPITIELFSNQAEVVTMQLPSGATVEGNTMNLGSFGKNTAFTPIQMSATDISNHTMEFYIPTYSDPLPSGMSSVDGSVINFELSSSGLLTTSTGNTFTVSSDTTYTFTVTANNSYGGFVDQIFTLTITV